MTTDSIEAWNDTLFLEQQTTIDVQQRNEIVKQMQQSVLDESPDIPIVYGVAWG